MKPTLKAPGSDRLRLECDKLLLNFAFNFNLRRYNKCRWNNGPDATNENRAQILAGPGKYFACHILG
jgi:hypothetical protein